MTRTVDKRFTFWLCGYYDDFTNAKAIPDDSNTMGSTWKSISTHHGNPLNGLAPYNPRYKFAWCVRGTGVGGANFSNTTGLEGSNPRKLHNNGMNEWLTFDPEWYNQGGYWGTSQLQYPDSKTNSNRQKFDGGTGLIGGTVAYLGTDPVEGYLMFSNSYNTQGKYYAFNGRTDSSYGRDTLWEWVGQLAVSALHPNAGEPKNLASTDLDYRIDTHLAGVYNGEIIISDLPTTGNNDAGAKKFMTPIHSPSKSNFLVQEVYAEQTHASSAYFPTLVYQNSLNCKGDTDTIVFRVAPMSNDTTNCKFRMNFGYGEAVIPITSAATADTAGTANKYAINFVIDTELYPLATDISAINPTSLDASIRSIWIDYELLLDFTNQRYQTFKNGVLIGGTTAFNAHPDGGRDWTPADFYGWELQAIRCEKKATMLIDRVGLIRHLNDYPLENLPPANSEILPIANKIRYNSTVNSISTFHLSLTDDEKTLKMLKFFNASSFSNWSLLCFRDNIDRPFWRGTLEGMEYKFDANERTPMIDLRAKDYFGDLDHEVPIWELGEGGDADSTSVVAYNRQESQNNLNTYYFGATALQVGNAGLGYNEVEDGTGTWESHVDSRMRLRSAHPIQIYNNEDELGLNDTHQKWDDAITATYATSAAQYRSLHSRWVQDLPKSRWFKHMFGKIKETPLATTRISTGANFTRGDTSLVIDEGGLSLQEGGHIEFVDSNGNCDSGVVLSASYASTHTDIQVAWLHYNDVDNSGNLVNVFSNAGANGKWVTRNNNGRDIAVALVPTTLNLHKKIRTITGSAWEIFNNEWGFYRTVDTVTQANASGIDTLYHIYHLRRPVKFSTTWGGTYYELEWWQNSAMTLSYNGRAFVDKRVAWFDITERDGLTKQYKEFVWDDIHNIGGSVDSRVNWWTFNPLYGFTNGATHYNFGLRFSRTWEIGATTESYNTFYSIGDNPTYTGTLSREGNSLPVTNAVGGSTTITLPATNFFQNDHAEHTTINILDIDDDFKHCYVLWADMRNDGNANADARFRKSEFGLLQPTSQNYELSLVYGDQNTDSGEEREEFVDLVLGQDVDMWEMDSMIDPITGTTWSSVTGGSDSEASKYRNWETKAGAFVIFDASKFFNLNTYSNGGKSGQIAGGRKEIGDYIVETEGFPILLDNYWKRATTTPDNINDFRAWTPYYRLLDNQGTGLKEEIRAGDRTIQTLSPVVKVFNNGTATDTTNLQFPTTCQIVSQEKEKIFHLNVARQIHTDTNVTLSPDSTGKVRITNVVDAYHLRDGHYITLSNTTTTPNIDGTYRLQFDINCVTGGTSDSTASWQGLIELDDPTVGILAGVGDISFENTYVIHRLLDLGVPNPLNKTVGGWDGSAYSGIGLTSAALVAGSRTIAHNSVANTLTLSATTGAMQGTFLTFGFVKGMRITIDDSSNGGNNGSDYLITNIDATGLIMTLDSLSTTIAATNTTSIYDKYYNTNSAEYLINNKLAVNTGVNPSIGTGYINPISGANPYHEGSQVAISLDDDGYPDATLYANASTIFPMRLMMQLNGFVKNRGSMTFMEHDKFRVTYLDSLTHNWLNQAILYGIPDIGTIPRTERMNIDQKDALTAGRAGMITVVAAGTVAGRNQLTSANHGLAVNDVIDIISSDVLSTTEPYRQQYTVVNVVSTSIFEVTTANTTYEATGTGMWRKVSALDTYGHVSDCRNTSIANIFSQVQQGSGLGDDVGTRTVFSYLMGRDSKPSFRPTYNNGFAFTESNLRVSSLSTSNSTQISNIRVFYAGSGAFVDYPQANLGAKPRWQILEVPNITSKDEALSIAKQEYEKQKEAPLSLSCEITKLSNEHDFYGSNDRMLYNARYGYVADQSRTIVGHYVNSSNTYTYDHAMYWTSLRGGNLFTGIQNALDYAGYSPRTPTNTSDTPPTQAYHFYGANSVSYAVQVVHIPHGMPKSSDDTPATGAGFTKTKGDGCLRIAIDIAEETSTKELNADSAYDSGNYIFRIMLLDYDFIATTTSTPAGVGFATLKSMSYVNVDSNGLYEIPIPDTYWAGTPNKTILVSVNYDYLASLVSRRMQGTDAQNRLNGNSFEGVTYSSTSDESIFPLGMRGWNDIGYWKKRREWYAPRLHIVDDINFVPATTLKYTDSRFELSDEPMSIRSVDWSIDGRNTEKVVLGLERDVSRAAKGFASYILPDVNVGGRQKGKGKGDGGGHGLLPPPPKGGRNSGKPQQGTQQTKYGDQQAGTTRSASLTPMDAPPRNNTPDGDASNSSNALVLGSTNMSRNFNNRVKGVMDFNNSSVVGSNFSVLGQKKPSSAPRDPHGNQSIDSFIIPEGGQAVMASNGFSMCGVGEGLIGYASMKVHLRIPANVSSDSIRIIGRTTLVQVGASAQKAIMYVTATCVETGASQEQTIHINSTELEQSQDITFFTGNLLGADVAGNTIEVLFEREAGQGDDDATRSAVSVHNLQIASDTRSVSGKKESNEFSYRL